MANVEHNTLGNTANMHGIVFKTVANATALAAETISAAALAQRYIWLQSDTRQLWIPKSTTTGDFEPFSVLGQSPGAFGPTPNTLVSMFEDFRSVTPTPITTNMVTQGGLTCNLVGTGTGSVLTSTTTERGYLQWSTGTGTTGQCNFLEGGGNNKSIAIQTSDALYLCARFSTATLSNGTDTFTAFFGFSSSSLAIGTDAYGILTDSTIDATHYVFKNRTSSANSDLTSTGTITAGQLDIIEAVKNAGSNTLTLYQNGSSIGTCTLPATTAAMTWTSWILKSAGTTARTINVDWVGYQILQPGKRAASFLA